MACGTGFSDQLHTWQHIPQERAQGPLTLQMSPLLQTMRGARQLPLYLKAWEIPYDCKLDLLHPLTEDT